MKLFKNYKFYIILAAVLCILVVKVLDVFGLSNNMEIVQNITTYILSALIAYNVITINVPTNSEKIAQDLKQSVEKINNKLDSAKDNENNEKKTNNHTQNI